MKVVKCYEKSGICYEILFIGKGEGYTLRCCFSSTQSREEESFCELESFSTEFCVADEFAQLMYKNLAMPIHISELAEEYLCMGGNEKHQRK